jgi:vacuolar-type H+-ATPase subunit I/STV1
MTLGIPIRWRKLIGLIALLVFMFYWAMLVMTVAVYKLPDNGLIEFAYFLAAGILWALPAGYIIKWMQLPDAEPQE